MTHTSGIPAPPGKPQFSIDVPKPTPPSVSAWVEELPLANTPYCLAALDAALEYFNRIPELSPETRVELAELLRPILPVQLQKVEALFIDSPAPYTADIQALASQGAHLHQELGMSYALAAVEPVSVFRAWRGGNSQQQIAAYRAFAHWGQALLWTSQQYRAPTEDYWSNLYRLFRVVESRNGLSARIDDPGEPEECKTPGGLFLRTLLFFLANARRFRQREMAMVFSLLGQMCGQARIGTEFALGEAMAEFYLDLGSARPPSRPRDPSRIEVLVPRFLHTRTLASELLDMDALYAESRFGTAIDKPVLERVARALGGLENRKSTRLPGSDACACLVGLTALIDALRAGLPPLGGATSGSRATVGLTVEEDAEPEESEAEARAARREALLRKSLAKKSRSRDSLSPEDIWSADPKKKPRADHAPPGMTESKVVNSSAKGFHILWPSQEAAKVRAGDLIGIWQGTPRRLASIGTVRWLESEVGGLAFGVELLSPSAEAVGIYDDTQELKGMALLLPVIPVLLPDPELLAPPGMIKEGEILQIQTATARVSYWIREALEVSQSFARYALTQM
jgi:hypothetical protein